MIFNPDITKHHPDLTFNGVPVAGEDHTKHLGVHLDSSRLNFSKHITKAIKKATKGLGLMNYLSRYVSRKVLELSYKLYVRPHLDYGDVIYHNQREDLMKLVEQVQYKAALIVSGCWQSFGSIYLCELVYVKLYRK